VDSNPPELTLGPGATRTVDLGYLVDAQDHHSFTIAMPTRPFSGIQHLPPGEYRFRLAVVANKFNLESYEIELTFDGLWLRDRLDNDLQVGRPHRV
jgi:hypothetical protein